QRHRPGRQLWRDGDIEFQAAGDRQLVALQPQGEEAVTIFFILPGAMNRFLNTVQPKLVIVMETELWPNMVAALHKRKIPLVIA
uniref:glycosyltransferase N-terminal domain-containing protein n=1 Tax=Klebsiella pneumoniae TaxID=573 RepID=UPI001C59EBC2